MLVTQRQFPGYEIGKGAVAAGGTAVLTPTTPQGWRTKVETVAFTTGGGNSGSFGMTINPAGIYIWSVTGGITPGNTYYWLGVPAYLNYGDSLTVHNNGAGQLYYVAAGYDFPPVSYAT